KYVNAVETVARRKLVNLSHLADCRQADADYSSISSASPGFKGNRDAAPPSLLEANYAQGAAGNMARQNCDPDVDWIQLAGQLNHAADSERDDDLGNDGNVERTPGVARPLKSAGVRERDRDEKTRDAQYAQKQYTDLHHSRLIHSENVEQLAG